MNLFRVEVQRPCSKRANPLLHRDVYVVEADDAWDALVCVERRLLWKRAVHDRQVGEARLLKTGDRLPPGAEILYKA